MAAENNRSTDGYQLPEELRKLDERMSGPHQEWVIESQGYLGNRGGFNYSLVLEDGKRVTETTPGGDIQVLCLATPIAKG